MCIRDSLEIAPRVEHEHAAIPVVLSRIDEGLRALEVRFLNELIDAMHATDRSSPADVAVAGLRGTGHDAESRKSPLVHDGERRAHRRLERRDITDDVIGRQHEEHGIRLGGGGCQS